MKFLIFVISLAFVGCTTDHDQVRQAVGSLGMTNITPGEWAFGACSSGDYNGRYFTATNPAGNRVSGVVCCGLLKRCTVRF